MNKLLRISGALLVLSLLLCPCTVAAEAEEPLPYDDYPFFFDWGPGRADVSVIIYGGWDGIPVKAWAGGAEQEILYTARDANGEAAVQWTFFPTLFDLYDVQIAPMTPPGLDSARWQYVLVRVEAPTIGLTVEAPEAAQLPVYRGSQYICYFQLVDTYALMAMEPLE